VKIECFVPNDCMPVPDTCQRKHIIFLYFVKNHGALHDNNYTTYIVTKGVYPILYIYKGEKNEKESYTFV
jgi:hypothetical protein